MSVQCNQEPLLCTLSMSSAGEEGGGGVGVGGWDLHQEGEFRLPENGRSLDAWG